MDGARGPLLLGVDAGGTSVDAVIAEPDGTVTGTGHAGPGNPVAVPLETVTGHVAEAVKKALRDADPARVASVVVGAAGVTGLAQADAVQVLERVLRQAGLGSAVRVVADPVVAFAAGTPARRGAVLVSGTGTIAAAVDGGEMISRVDGHGWLVGDDGSGFWLGRQAARAVLAELDGRGEPTALRQPVLAAMTGRDELPYAADQQISALLDVVYGGPPTGLARLAALVPASAEAGDRVAQGIVDRAVALLMRAVEALLAGRPPGPMVLAGSVLTSPGPIQREMRRRITERRGAAPVIAGSGAGGAAWLAALDLAARCGGPRPGEAVHASLTACQPSPDGG